ncbi:MAG: molybdenum cofactor guanylyltransferase MobA [Rhodobacteraceae bacterium]|nr:molybdenum cofactor guanylyltransferase MobA [Paracoccaceae bacterium]
MVIKGVPLQNTLTCILAGGQSRRMGGGDKTLLSLGGHTMLAQILERVRDQSHKIILNANNAAERFEDYGLPVVSDAIEGFLGPLAGLLSAMTYAKQHSPEITHIITVSSDSPFLPIDLIDRFCTSTPVATPVLALASSRERLHPVFGLWPISLESDLRSWLQQGKTGKVLAWADRHDSIEISFPDDPDTGLDPFFNVNTPEDLDTARRMVGVASRLDL